MRRRTTGTVDNINSAIVGEDLLLQRANYYNLVVKDEYSGAPNEGIDIPEDIDTQIGGGGGGGGSPIQEAGPIPWPYTQDQIGSWDCLLLEAKMAEIQTALQSGSLTTVQSQVYGQSLQYMTQKHTACIESASDETANPPYTQSEIDSWPCGMVTQKVQELRDFMQTARLTEPANAVYVATLNYMLARERACHPQQSQTTNDQPPIAVAGNAKTIQLPSNSLVLDGSSSYDPENGHLTFLWSQTSGPTTATMTNPSSASVMVEDLQAGYYSFKLSVTDVMGNTSNSSVNVTVLAPGEANNGPRQPSGDGSTTIQTTAPVLVQTFSPYGAGGAGGAAAKSTQEQVKPKKVNWLLWVFVITATSYIVFAKNE